MEKKKPKKRMGRPPVPVDQLRPHKYKVSLSHRDQALLEAYHEQRPHLTRSSAVAELAHFMLEIFNNPQVGLTHMTSELVHSAGVEANQSQAEIDFNTSMVISSQLEVLKNAEPEMEKLLNDSLNLPILPQ